jgi:hypothetical protein
MHALAAFIMKNRASAILAVVLFAVGSWFIAILGLLSAAAVALPTLRKGSREGAAISAVALPAVATGAWMTFGEPWPAIYSALVLWVPVWMVSILLRHSGNLAMALLGAGALGMLALLTVYLLLDDPGSLWVSQLNALAQSAPSEGGLPDASLSRTLERMARFVPGMMAAGLVTSVTASVFIARHWQAALFNPGGFGSEFRGLRLPKVLGYLWLSLLITAWASRPGAASELLANLAAPPSILFVLAGLSVVHAVCFNRQNGRFWLTGVYLALLFVSPLIVAILAIGFSDTWINWRQGFTRV